ncbi:MAG: hypothetical protein DMF24_05205 [Verrucomicrobia bacterium]|nr:MAG: hypothetical protein DME90_00655 [Verrucomicrobiota bacterium]PYL62137.1 MAG: hypothetical protein DMF24_05205 [Verrucomicrobiota bacterium]
MVTRTASLPELDGAWANPISQALVRKQRKTTAWMREKLIAIFGRLGTAAPRRREDFMTCGAYGQGDATQDDLT